MAEGEVNELGAELCAGHITAATYFASLPGAANRKFIGVDIRNYAWHPALFDFVEKNTRQLLDREQAAVSRVVARSCELKAEVVRQDEREETGMRAILNYGHTFAHAFETVLGYGEKWIDSKTDTYFNTAKGTIEAFSALVDDIRAARQIKG